MKPEVNDANGFAKMYGTDALRDLLDQVWPDDYAPPTSPADYGLPPETERDDDLAELVDEIKIGKLPPLTLDDWAKRDLPPPDFLLGNWLTTTSRVLLSASTGIGKTNVAIAIGMRVSDGAGFLHWQGRRPARPLH